MAIPCTLWPRIQYADASCHDLGWEDCLCTPGPNEAKDGLQNSHEATEHSHEATEHSHDAQERPPAEPGYSFPPGVEPSAGTPTGACAEYVVCVCILVCRCACVLACTRPHMMDACRAVGAWARHGRAHQRHLQAVLCEDAEEQRKGV